MCVLSAMQPSMHLIKDGSKLVLAVQVSRRTRRMSSAAFSRFSASAAVAAACRLSTCMAGL